MPQILDELITQLYISQGTSGFPSFFTVEKALRVFLCISISPLASVFFYLEHLKPQGGTHTHTHTNGRSGPHIYSYTNNGCLRNWDGWNGPIIHFWVERAEMQWDVLREFAKVQDLSQGYN